MSTLQQISAYAKMMIPFLAGMYSLLVPYGDRHRGWKLIGSLLSALLLFGVGCLSIFATK
jgi:hypothetical protein